MWGEYSTPLGFAAGDAGRYSDWRVGFGPGEISKRNLGLQGIRERTRLLSGRVEIESTLGTGTRIFVELPLENVPEEAVITNDRSIK